MIASPFNTDEFLFFVQRAARGAGRGIDPSQTLAPRAVVAPSSRARLDRGVMASAGLITYHHTTAAAALSAYLARYDATGGATTAEAASNAAASSSSRDASDASDAVVARTPARSAGGDPRGGGT